MHADVKKLLSIASSPFALEGIDYGVRGLERFGDIGKSIREVMEARNGFFCFESALRFFPSTTVEASWGMLEWNSHDLWKFEYQGLADDVFCFAEDIFGRQFSVARGIIAVFEPETGEVEELAPTFEAWVSRLLNEYQVMTGYDLAHDWQTTFGPLPPRHRLMPKKPFVLGGEYKVSNLTAVDSVKLMRNLGNLAHQIHDLPDGAQIQFRVL